MASLQVKYLELKTCDACVCKVGFFETLDGNAVRGASEEREEREEKRKSRNRSRARVPQALICFNNFSELQ